MNIITKKTGIMLLFAIASLNLAAQDRPCATDVMVQRSLEENPSLRAAYDAEQNRLDQLDKEAYKTGYQSKAAAVTYTIPVVFHIIHLGGPENISDAQIHDEMRILNEDYSKTNADFSATVATFVPIAADAQIIFKLAQKDPSGNCTNGIDRIYSNQTNIGDDGSKLNPWPRNKYLNVWVVKIISSGAAGYAYLPGTATASTDGIMILSSYIGSIGTGSLVKSHALTHEIGHFLNLKHCWGGTNNPGVDCSGTDNVSDTPQTMGWSSCNLSGATCGSSLDNVQNFMEYSYCSTMFTAGQKTRMQNALNSALGQRSSLWTAANLSATGVSLPAVLCTADFEGDATANTICAGGTVTYTDLSWNGTPTSWSWVFPGGTPATSTSSSPTVTYNTPGIYDVSLTASNASGSVSTTKTSYITVNSATAMYTTSMYTEGFEGSAIPNADWQVHNLNAGSNTWVQTSTAAATGSKSVMITNASTYDGYVDELIGPSFDVTAIGGTPTLTFKVAHAQATSTSADKLSVYVSTNCGQTWSLRKNLQGATLSTAGIQSTPFTPNASQWITQSVNLSGYAAATNLYYMFRFTSNGGNNIFLDDINILGNVGVEELSETLNFSVYPNPADDNTVVHFELPGRNKVDVSVVDVLGRKVLSLADAEMAAGEYQFPVSGDQLLPGVYFIRLNVGTSTFTKKLLIK